MNKYRSAFIVKPTSIITFTTLFTTSYWEMVLLVFGIFGVVEHCLWLQFAVGLAPFLNGDAF
jgi:hypothetical protein